MNKQNTEFARLETLQGEKFFRRSAVSSFGYTEKTSTTNPTVREVRIVYQTSVTSSEDATYRVLERKDFDNFRDSILENSRETTETPAAPAGDVALQDRL